VRYESWVERQVREAIERGEFDNLPGAGQPIPDLNGRDEDNWWVKRFLEREKLPMPLPASLALRKEVAELPQELTEVPDEDAVRQIIGNLNQRIRDSHRRRVDGPPVVVALVDVEATVAEWRRNRAR
jgi:DnaJ homologue, subfamily C, member 28, conserved domain